MDAKQFSWIYMITHGYANVQKSYYGGYKTVDTTAVGVPRDSVLFTSYSQYNESFISEIKRVGVNWKKTFSVSEENVSVFNGTFADSGEEQVLTGVLVLNNGYKQHWSADRLVDEVFQIMANVQVYEEKFNQIFKSV